jgi:hypothetical protein
VTHGHMSGGLSPFPRTGGFLAATGSLMGTPAVHHLGRTGLEATEGHGGESWPDMCGPGFMPDPPTHSPSRDGSRRMHALIRYGSASVLYGSDPPLRQA